MNFPLEDLQKKSFERKIQKAAANLRASVQQLPSSIRKKELQLIPNSISTKTFKEGLTLHTLLCGTEMERRTLSQENLVTSGSKGGRSIPFYRNIDDCLSSSPQTSFIRTTSPLTTREPLRECYLQNEDEKAKETYETPKRKSDRRRNEIHDARNFVPSATSSPKSHILICPTKRSNVFDKLGRPEQTHNEECFESAFEESFDTEERERREQSSVLVNQHERDQQIFHSSSTFVKHLFGNGFAGIGHEPEDESSTLVGGELNGSSATLIGGLDQSVKELQEALACANEKFGTMADHLDRTLNDTSFGVGGGADDRTTSDIEHKSSVPLLTEMKSTQTPSKWKTSTDFLPKTINSSHNPSENRSRVVDQVIMKYSDHRLDHRHLDGKNSLIKESATQDDHNSTTSQRKFQTDCKKLVRKYIEVLREHTIARLHLLAAERKELPAHMKRDDPHKQKYKALMEEFDEAKRRTKNEMMDPNANMELVKKYYIQINNLERETLVLQSRHEQIQQLRTHSRNMLSSSRFCSSTKQKCLSDKHRRTDDVTALQAPLLLTQQPPPSPYIPPLNLVLLSPSDEGMKSSCNEESKLLPSSPLFALPPQPHIAPIEPSASEDVFPPNSEPSSKVNKETIVKSPIRNVSSEEGRETCSEKITSAVFSEISHIGQEEEVAVISARSVLESGSSTQRTSAEIESIPEEILSNERSRGGMPFHASSLTASSKSSTSTLRREERQSSSADRSDASAKKCSNEDDGMLISHKSPLSVHSKTSDNLGARHESAATLYPKESNSKTIESINIEFQKSHVNPEEIDEVAISNNSNTSVTEELSDEVVSFKPSEKSLQSILSSIRTNSVSSNERESIGKHRRDSASEALLKLRLMNCVPELRSPRESKSPPKTPMPMSPRGVERFMTKYPQNKSRETSFSEDLGVKSGELLDELPNASQLGMVLDLSCSPTKSTLVTSRRESLCQPGTIAQKRLIIEEMAECFWKNYKEHGPNFDKWTVDGVESSNGMLAVNQEEDNVISDDVLRMFVIECVQNVLQTGTSRATFHHIFKDEQSLATYLQRETIGLLAERGADETCTAAIKARAEKTSHVLLDTNRLLLAKFLYEQVNDWPTENMLIEADAQALKALLGRTVNMDARK